MKGTRCPRYSLVRVHVIPAGADVSETQLGGVAATTSGDLFPAPSLNDLPAIYNETGAWSADVGPFPYNGFYRATLALDVDATATLAPGEPIFAGPAIPPISLTPFQRSASAGFVVIHGESYPCESGNRKDCDGDGRVDTANGDVYGHVHFQFLPTTQQLTDVTGSGFTDRCVPIRRAMIQLRLVGKSWRLNDDNLSLWDFGTDVHSVRFTLDMLHRYGVTHLCYVGRKGRSFSYLLADGKAPTGAIEGETCKVFDADRLATIEAQGSYALAAESQTVRTFADKVEADAALVAIMKYRFTHLCAVGENKPSLEYMRR